MRRTISAPLAVGIMWTVLLPLGVASWSSDAMAAATKQGETAKASGRGHDKVALLVGISKYPPAGGWQQLNTENDMKLIRGALEAQGFESGNIHTLIDEAADREGIVAAFRSYLIEGAGRGAAVVFHYSGHGQQITDDDHDEIDGYDEALVPFDAPGYNLAEAQARAYDGSKHLRDDDLHDLLLELRRKLGPKGDVLLSLDCCFSGSATRGAAVSRGSLKPLGLPQPPRKGDKIGEDRGGGAVEGTRGAAAGAASRGDGKLAEFTFISASRHDEEDQETVLDNSEDKVGSLSYALSRALREAGENTTYAGLFSEVRKFMASKGVKNVPQLEGNPARKILGGKAVSQKPHYSLLSYDKENKTAHVTGGQLAGLRDGSRVAVFPVDTQDPEGKKPLATGVVRNSMPVTSEVLFDEVDEGAEIAAGWLFVTEAAFGDARIRVHVGDGAWRIDLLKHLESSRNLMEKAESIDAADVVIEKVVGKGDTRVAVRTRDGTQLGEPIASDAELWDNVRQRLEDFARNRWLRGINPKSSDIQVTMKIRPCKMSSRTGDLGESIENCDGDLEGRETEGGLALRDGDGVEITLENTGREPAYITLLELMPDGQIGQIYPPDEQRGADNLLEPGKSIPWQGKIAPPFGNNMYKLFATAGQVDFRPILSGHYSSGTRGAPLDGFLKGAFHGTRGTAATVKSGSVSTTSITFTISPAEAQ